MSNKDKRINIWIPNSTLERIERLRVTTQAPSMTEVIKAALLAYETLTELLAESNEIHACKNGEFRQLHFIIDVPKSQK